jgi:hypothetical protein
MKRLVVFAVLFGVLGSVVAGNAAASGPLSLPRLSSPTGIAGATVRVPLRARYAHPVTHVSTPQALTQSAAATTVRMWQRTVTDGGTTYGYTMVGKNPFVAQPSPTATIPTYVISLRLVFNSFGNEVFDAAAPDACDPAQKSDQARVLNSPIFKTAPFSFGGTSVGAPSQYLDAFQRAEFWSKTQPGSINPGYNVNLGNPADHVLSLTVPVTGGDVVAGTCGDIGLIDFNTWDNYVQTQLFPLLAAQSPPVAPPTSMVIFLLHDTVLYQGTTSNCCILGYHSAFDDPAYGGATHTYASVEYDSSKTFSGVEDIAPLSHEVGEWMNDPLGNNATPAWGNIGQVSGCQSNLEVGDPLSGNTLRVFLNAFTYHPQELAFFSWFYHQKQSLGINRWYSNNDSLESPAAACS